LEGEAVVVGMAAAIRFCLAMRRGRVAPLRGTSGAVGSSKVISGAAGASSGLTSEEKSVLVWALSQVRAKREDERASD
jgi:hypothetical protein